MLAGHINLVFAQSLSLLSRKPKVGFTGRRRTGVGEMAVSDTRNTLPTFDISIFSRTSRHSWVSTKGTSALTGEYNLTFKWGWFWIMIANKRSTAEIRDGIAIKTHRERKHAGLEAVS